MKAFLEAYQEIGTVVPIIEKIPIFTIPWCNNSILLRMLNNNDQRFWYAQQAIQNGWSRSTLETWIESDLSKR